MSEAVPPAPSAPCCCQTEHFTERELGLLRQVAAGATNEEIAELMNISGHTVATHLRTMLTRSQAHNRAELVARAYAGGILSPHAWPPQLSGRRCLQALILLPRTATARGRRPPVARSRVP